MIITNMSNTVKFSGTALREKIEAYNLENLTTIKAVADKAKLSEPTLHRLFKANSGSMNTLKKLKKVGIDLDNI